MKWMSFGALFFACIFLTSLPVQAQIPEWGESEEEAPATESAPVADAEPASASEKVHSWPPGHVLATQFLLGTAMNFPVTWFASLLGLFTVYFGVFYPPALALLLPVIALPPAATFGAVTIGTAILGEPVLVGGPLVGVALGSFLGMGAALLTALTIPMVVNLDTAGGLLTMLSYSVMTAGGATLGYALDYRWQGRGPQRSGEYSLAPLVLPRPGGAGVSYGMGFHLRF